MISSLSKEENKALISIINANHSPIHKSGEGGGIYYPPNYIFLPKWLESFPLSLRWYCLWHEVRHMEEDKQAILFNFATFPYNDLVRFLVYHSLKIFNENPDESVKCIKHAIDIETKLALIYRHANFVREAIPTYLQCINYDRIFEWISNKGVEKEKSLEMKSLGSSLNQMLEGGKGLEAHVEGFNLANKYYGQCSTLDDFFAGMNIVLQIEPIKLLQSTLEDVQNKIQEYPLKHDANYRCNTLINNPSDLKPVIKEALARPELTDAPFEISKKRMTEVLLDKTLPKGFREFHQKKLAELKPVSNDYEALVDTMKLKRYNTPHGLIYYYTVAMNDEQSMKTFYDSISLDYSREKVIQSYGYSRYGSDFLKSVEYLLEDISEEEESERYHHRIDEIIELI